MPVVLNFPIEFHSMFSYFTDLSYIGIIAYFWASGVQTLAYALGRGKQYPLQRWPRPLQFLHSLLFSTITSFRESSHRLQLSIHYNCDPSAILVAIVYWIELSGPATFASKFSSMSLSSSFIAGLLMERQLGQTSRCTR